MDRCGRYGAAEDDWEFSNPTVIDYHHQPPPSGPEVWQSSGRVEDTDNFNEKLYKQLQVLSGKIVQDQIMSQPLPRVEQPESKKFERADSIGLWTPAMCTQETTPFPVIQKTGLDAADDMDISDDENPSQNKTNTSIIELDSVDKHNTDLGSPVSLRRTNEVTSGAAFYKGLILFIPPFEQLSNSYRGSPAVKMLYASFEFSFGIPVKITTSPRESSPKVMDATVYFQNNILATGSGWAPHVEASVRALELLSETCYTIQAKGDYFQRCKLLNAENMKTLNLKKWEAVSQKYPKLIDITKESHIQKTFAVFLENHTSSGMYEDMVCYNLTNKDVNHVKCVIEFFHLTMLPCGVSSNLTEKETPCVVSIHKYTSAQTLLEILVECGGENDNFMLHPPDTFKDFYKLHQNYWDPSQRDLNSKTSEESKTTLDDEDFQLLIMKPYENTITELFEKHKTLPKTEKSTENPLRKAGDDFMKDTLKIDMAHSKKKAPVERMQLLLKYMEQLQEYGSRVLDSGRPEMIKIYHNAIDNLRKDLEDCRKDMEKEQKNKESNSNVTGRKTAAQSSSRKKSPTRRRSPSRRSEKSPVRRRNVVSPKRRPRSRTPVRNDRSRRSPSPRRTQRSKSPRRRDRSPPRRDRSSRNVSSPTRHARSPRPSSVPQEEQFFVTIFKDQFKRFVDMLRRFRIEIEDTPIEIRPSLKDRLQKCNEQLNKFFAMARENMAELGGYMDEIDVLKEELSVQENMVAGKPGPNDVSQNVNPPLWRNVIQPAPLQTSYPLPYGARIPPPPSLYGGAVSTNYQYNKP